MKIFKRSVSALLALLAFAGTMRAADYGLPAEIQQGNILHCFNWSAKEVKNSLPEIAAAGFGSVQLSPLQRPDISAKGSSWHDLYRPYDLAFKPSAFCSEQDLKDLCSAAATYGIKVIVDVVANHVDKTAGYHDTWWDSNNRVRWEGGINYGNRYSITHGQLGDYGDVNSEHSDVIARGKAYVEKLKSLGVKGIRWDAAKHIGLPSESCGFWSGVTSISGMYHYGEILDAPGPDHGIIKEYANYMSVTDNEYCNYAAKSNGGIPGGYAGEWVVQQGLPDTKLVYWAESHDTYSNDEWSQNVDQSVIDRAYAAYGSRNGATCLYLARPDVKGFGNIKTGKGNSTAFKSKQVSEVNKFRNAMVGRKDYFSGNGNACSITREGGGAVIVMKGSGYVKVPNGGGYCPAGTYTDHVSGGRFTVTATDIEGNVGSSGIAVIYNGGDNPNPNPNPDPDPDPDPDTDTLWILGNIDGAQWTTDRGAEMTLTNGKFIAKNVKLTAATGETKCYFNITDALGEDWDALNAVANRYGAAEEGVTVTLNTPVNVVKYAKDVDASGCLSWNIDPGTYDFSLDLTAMKLTVTGQGSIVDPDPDPDPDPNPNPDPDNLPYINGVYLKNTSSWTEPHAYVWKAGGTPVSSAWPGSVMVKYNDSYWKWEAPAGSAPANIIFNPGGDNGKTADLDYVAGGVYDCSGTLLRTISNTDPNPNPNPDPDPDPTDFTIYYDNSKTNWSNVLIHYWSTPSTEWPGATMTKVEDNVWKYTFSAAPTSLAGFLFNDGNGNQTADFTEAPKNNHIYKGAGGVKGAVTDEGEYQEGPQPEKPVVTATPASGTVFEENLTVTLSVAPAATIYYTVDGSAPSTASKKYSAPIYIEATTTIKTLAVTSDGGKNEQSFSYRKKSQIVVTEGKKVETNYYKVNPNEQVGRERTVNAVYEKLNNDNRMCVAKNALSNWTEEDLIAQGVARDIASAVRGRHEYPVIDSYALYGAYDDNNVYLGVQYVYSTYDLYGDGILSNGAAKPYNMDGRIIIAFDLDPEKSFSGILGDGNTIWDADGAYNTFDNGADCLLYCSTKSTVGVPGLFFPDANGNASYDSQYCVGLDAPFYGCQDGLLPSIDHIWGQAEFGFDPEVLLTNDGFADIRGKMNDDQHTFYEFTIPYSKLGISKDIVKNQGIGVMIIDTYGQGAIGSTPYDPTVLDNANIPYSKDDSSSHEKEDKDIFTYDFARLGKLGTSTAVNIIDVDYEGEPEYFTLQGVKVQNPEQGVYIVRRGSKVSKIVIR